MVEMTPEIQSTSGQGLQSTGEVESMATVDIHDTGLKIQRAKEAYQAYAGLEEKPTKMEVLTWFLYGLCSYFIHTVLLPIVFPLLISQIFKSIPMPPQGWEKTPKGFACNENEMKLFERLTHASIRVRSISFSPFEWTSISWVLGLILAAPALGVLSVHLDYGQNQRPILAAATAIGALFCLPAGAFSVAWMFPPYVAAIVAANTVCAASHNRHLGLMVRGFIGSCIRKSQFPDRRAVSSWLSLYATAAGCFGSAVISSFTYHMLGHHERFLSLWVVSIFSGLQWCAGIIHAFVSNRPGANTTSIPKTHAISIFKYPHAAGSLAGVFFSSCATMCIFTGGVLYLVGQLCLKPKNLLYLWLTYFIFPVLSLPLVQPLQQLIRADAVKMQLLGFLLSTLTSGIGFYYRREDWKNQHVLVFAAIQSVATGLLHAFGRVLLLDCSPAGKEGAFSVWFSWVRDLGTCAGFAVASAGHGNINRAFGVAFCTAIAGIFTLMFGNISNFGGAIAAGHIRENSEKSSPERGLENVVEEKVPESVETPYKRNMEA